jgi:hypothetical protein
MPPTTSVNSAEALLFRKIPPALFWMVVSLTAKTAPPPPRISWLGLFWIVNPIRVTPPLKKLRRAAPASVEAKPIGGDGHPFLAGARGLQRVAGFGLLQCTGERLSFIALDLLDRRIGARNSHPPFQMPRHCQHT